MNAEGQSAAGPELDPRGAGARPQGGWLFGGKRSGQPRTASRAVHNSRRRNLLKTSIYSTLEAMKQGGLERLG